MIGLPFGPPPGATGPTMGGRSNSGRTGQVMDIALLSAEVPAGPGLRGRSLDELRLPAPAAVVLVVRDGRMFAPATDTVLRNGDELVVATPTAHRDAVERRLRAVGRRGPLAIWPGERGEPRTPPDPSDPRPRPRALS